MSKIIIPTNNTDITFFNCKYIYMDYTAKYHKYKKKYLNLRDNVIKDDMIELPKIRLAHRVKRINLHVNDYVNRKNVMEYPNVMIAEQPPGEYATKKNEKRISNGSDIILA